MYLAYSPFPYLSITLNVSISVNAPIFTKNFSWDHQPMRYTRLRLSPARPKAL